MKYVLENGKMSDIFEEKVNSLIKEQVESKTTIITPISVTLNCGIYSFQNMLLTQVG